jgi:DNA polymerase (family 10)
MHTTESDGANSIREMAEAALARGLEYIAITDHSKNLAMTNGMDDARTLAHAARIRKIAAELQADIAEVNAALAQGREFPSEHRLARLYALAKHRSAIRNEELAQAGNSDALHPLPNFRLMPGIEVDILLDGSIDLANETLAQLDVVIASVHSGFAQSGEEMTARMLRACENPFVQILGHPTGRKVLKRDPYRIDLNQLLPVAAKLGIAVEHNSAPARSDLSDLHLRQAKELGCKISVNTDAHSTDELDLIDHGIVQLRRAWLTPADLINCLPVDQFLAALRQKP